MKALILHALRWAALYSLLVAIPLWLMFVGPMPERRPFFIEFGVAIGFVGLALMCVQFLLTGRFWQIGKPFGVDTILQFHRQAGIVGLVFIVAHVVVLLAADADNWAFFDPRVNGPRAIALVVVLFALAGLVLLSLRRRSFNLSYEWWRITHGLLAVLVVFIGVVHANMVGYYVNTPFRRAVWIIGVLAAVALFVYIRIFKPWRMAKLPWHVANVKRERGDSWSLTLTADNHDGLRFKPGQYAWITLGDTPFKLQQHPFSLSSSAADPQNIRFTIKELGDFTGTLGDVPVGTRAFVEGPYGHFLARDGEPTIMIAGGIGVTPFISMLRTAADANSSEIYYLFYGIPRWEDAILREEIAELESRLPNLTVVYVVSDDDPEWTGETGYIDRDIIERHVPLERRSRLDYMVCGPDAMLDAVHAELKKMNVPPHRQRSERFNMV